MIRTVKISDAGRLIEIYAPYVLTPITFETSVPTVEDFTSRIEDYTQKYPWFVWEENGHILGYAYASSHRSRCAYAWSAECSIYIDEKYRGKGIGKKLYQKLFACLKEQGVISVLAGITLPNPTSIKIHESFGFEQIATYKNIGFKTGQWWDVGWWQLQLDKPVEPRPLLPPIRL